MKLIQKTALILAASILVGAPVAIAADKKEDKKAEKKAGKPAKLVLSKGFGTAYAPVLTLLQKANLVGAYAGWPAVKMAIVNDDDRSEAGVFAYDLGTKMAKSGDAALKANSSALRIDGIDLVLASTKTPADIRPAYMYQRAAIIYDSKDFVKSTIALQDAYAAGYRENEIEILLSNSYSQQKKYADAITWLRTAINNNKSVNRAVPPEWYAQGGNYALRMRDNKSASVWFKDYLVVEKSAAAWHDALATYNVSPELEPLEALDVYRLMHLSGSMQFENEYRGYAELIDRRRYPTEIYRILQEGIDKKMVKLTPSITEAFNEAKTLSASDATNASLSEASARKSAVSYDALLTGESYMGLRNFTKAQEMYELAMSKGAVRDREGKDQTGRLMLHLAMAKIYQGNFQGGRADLAKIPAGNRKNIGEYWAIYADQQMSKSASPVVPAVK